MNQGIIVLGHGSRASVGEANRVVFQITDIIRERVGHDLVETAIMNSKSELATIGDAVASLAARGVERIVIVPLFFANGMHIQYDIPEEITVLANRFPDVTVAMAPPIGPDPRIADILLDRIREVE